MASNQPEVRPSELDKRVLKTVREVTQQKQREAGAAALERAREEIRRRSQFIPTPLPSEPVQVRF